MSNGIDIPGGGRHRQQKLIGISGRSPPVHTWVNDNSVTKCHRCGVAFGFMTRRHHCRMCGRIFCDPCSGVKVVIPERLRTIMPSSPPSLIPGFLSATPASESRPRRVCLSCSKDINDHKKCDKIIEVLGLIMNSWFQLDNTVMQQLLFVNSSWSKSALFYIKRFHTLVVARLPSDKLDNDRLAKFQSTLRGNIILILKNYPAFVPDIIRLDPPARFRIPANLLKSPCMDIFSAFNILDSPFNLRDSGVIGHMKSVAKTSILASNTNMEHYLTRLVFLENQDTIRIATKTLTRICIDRMYWIARVYRPEVTSIILEGRPKVAQEISLSLDLLNVLSMLVQTKTNPEKRKLCKSWRTRNKGKTVYLPGMYPKSVKNIMWKKITQKKSSTIPVVIPCTVVEEEAISTENDIEEGKNSLKRSTQTIDILFKQEDVFRDVVMMDCLGIIHETLMKSKQLDWLLNIVWYAVVPVSKNSGIVAMVPKSRTLHGIQQTLKMSLLNYLLEHNTSCDIHTLRMGFVRSCAVCSMQSLLFGLGDRHLENILLTETGNMFHVDYSYLFGKEPHVKTLVDSGRMKLTPSIIDVMGGKHSRYFQHFLDKSDLIFRLLRSQAPVFYCVCYPLVLVGHVSKDVLLKHFYNVFRPGEAGSESSIQIENIINYNTQHRMMDSILDRMHNVCTVFF